MTVKPENRRVRMTKRMMKDALLELLEQKELANITVTEICQAADVNRSTFYKYYAVPADLLREIEQDFMDRIPSPVRIREMHLREQFLESAAAFFDYVRENSTALRVLFSNSADRCFSARFVEFLCSGYIPVAKEADEQTGRFTRLYVANGIVGMIREWVYADCPIPSRQFAGMLYTLSGKIIS